jgi:hypothetical protein
MPISALRWLVAALVWAALAAPAVMTAAWAYEADRDAARASVAGRVVFAGPLPKSKPSPVHRDSAFCGTSMPNEALRITGDVRALASVVVSLEGVLRGKPVVPDLVSFANRNCRFQPRISAAAVGSQIEITNSDPIMHNTHIHRSSRFGPTVLNVAQPAGGNVIRKPLQETGLLDVRCDAHPFMFAAIHVFEHPYFAVTDETGRFELTHVPPGTYRLRLWHEMFGTREMPITVPETDLSAGDVEFRSEE